MAVKNGPETTPLRAPEQTENLKHKPEKGKEGEKSDAELAKELVNSAKKGLSNTGQAIENSIEAVLTAAIGGTRATGRGIEGGVKAVGAAAKATWEGLKKAAGWTGDKAREGAKAVGKGVESVGKGALDITIIAASLAALAAMLAGKGVYEGGKWTGKKAIKGGEWVGGKAQEGGDAIGKWTTETVTKCGKGLSEAWKTSVAAYDVLTLKNRESKSGRADDILKKYDLFILIANSDVDNARKRHAKATADFSKNPSSTAFREQEQAALALLQTAQEHARFQKERNGILANQILENSRLNGLRDRLSDERKTRANTLREKFTKKTAGTGIEGEVAA